MSVFCELRSVIEGNVDLTYHDNQVIIPSTTGLSDTACMGSRLVHAGTNNGLIGGTSDNSGSLTAAFHPEDKLPPMFRSESGFVSHVGRAGDKPTDLLDFCLLPKMLKSKDDHR